MAKRIINKNSILEAKRAQAATDRESFVAIEGVSAKAVELKSSFALPTLTIKRDLKKDLVYAVAAVAIIFVLKHSQYGFSIISSLLSQ